ncbi:MAG: lactate racemase domain-containing protein [Clostridia bacterium]
MPILTQETASVALPKMIRLRQRFDSGHLADHAIVTRHVVAEACRLLPPRARVAVAVGSRGIRNLQSIVGSVVGALRESGADPFIVAAMGSHGGGTSQGQREVLASYGITEKAIRAPIETNMDTMELGCLPSGVPVRFSKAAMEADAVVPIARIKPHTDYRGSIESGLCKMLAIGLGKHEGCARLHKEGFHKFPVLIPEVASFILGRVKVPFGIAILENAYDETFLIEAVPGNQFLKREAELLPLAKSLMPRLLFHKIDVLVVEHIGKDISGAGMDPNIVGRTTKGILEGFMGPEIGRIVVLGLSEASHGNAIGIGLADFTVEDILDRIDRTSTFANAVASGNPESGRIPIALANEDEAIRAALACLPEADPLAPRIVRITDTLHLGELLASKALVDDLGRDPRLIEAG